MVGLCRGQGLFDNLVSTSNAMARKLTGWRLSGWIIYATTPDKDGWLCDDGVTYWR